MGPLAMNARGFLVAAVVVAPSLVGCGGGPLTVGNYIPTLKSPFTDDAIPFCPATLMGDGATPIPATPGFATTSIAVDDKEDVHTLVISAFDPLTSLIGGDFVFDIGPIGSIYTETVTATATAPTALRSIQQNVEVKRTFVGGTRTGDDTFELTFAFEPVGEIFEVQNPDLENVSCEPESATLVWEFVGG